MLNSILKWTIYLPHNLWIILTKKNKKTEVEQTILNNRSMISAELKIIKTENQLPIDEIDDPNKIKIQCKYLPEKKSDEAAAYDLKAVLQETRLIFRAGEVHLVPTSLHIEIPKGKCGLLFIRSGLSSTTTLTLANGVGLIDSDYRGEILVPLRNVSLTKRASIGNGDRIAQLLIIDCFTPELTFSKNLSNTKRNTSGFGSTGVK